MEPVSHLALQHSDIILPPCSKIREGKYYTTCALNSTLLFYSIIIVITISMDIQSKTHGQLLDKIKVMVKSRADRPFKLKLKQIWKNNELKLKCPPWPHQAKSNNSSQLNSNNALLCPPNFNWIPQQARTQK